jgi:hypothetical protein
MRTGRLEAMKSLLSALLGTVQVLGRESEVDVIATNGMNGDREALAKRTQLRGDDAIHGQIARSAGN